MSSKMDRQGARTPAELERRYNFGKRFSEVMGVADGARIDAGNASEAVAALDRSLDAEGVFNRLTDYGTAEGIYRDEDGNIYINASYIQSGEIGAENVTINGGCLKAGQIKSKNYALDADGNCISGMMINLEDGEIIAPSFSIDENGKAYLKSGGDIGGFTVTQNGIVREVITSAAGVEMVERISVEAGQIETYAQSTSGDAVAYARTYLGSGRINTEIKSYGESFVGEFMTYTEILTDGDTETTETYTLYIDPTTLTVKAYKNT